MKRFVSYVLILVLVAFCLSCAKTENEITPIIDSKGTMYGTLNGVEMKTTDFFITERPSRNEIYFSGVFTSKAPATNFQMITISGVINNSLGNRILNGTTEYCTMILQPSGVNSMVSYPIKGSAMLMENSTQIKIILSGNTIDNKYKLTNLVVWK